MSKSKSKSEGQHSDTYAQYLRDYKAHYAALNRGVEGGRKPKKKNRRTGNNWAASQRIFKKLKRSPPWTSTQGRRRRGNN